MAPDYKLRALMTTDSAADLNLHSPQRQLIELRMEHANLDSLIDRAAHRPWRGRVRQWPG